MKLIQLAFLAALFGCSSPSQSTYPTIVAEEAVSLAQENCTQNQADFSWLRTKISELENAPYTQQAYIYLFRKGPSVYFTVGPRDIARLKGPVYDCQGKEVAFTRQKRLNAMIVYTPPAYRR